ncbi:VOC family protein [Pseudonocardia halophobica]|uniref:Glyoxalase n=1 Tax=Pseudonocardia halophobica TaxID=29401 RepID=A0A9W6NUT6_9PSEU|nr:VOC family protein [Pseudonocardia halophobica]GLL10154.1 glyoxalase [Pseudonocardia halophobica]
MTDTAPADTAPSGSGRPALGGFHHFSATVNDVEDSAAWYERVLGLQRIPASFPHADEARSGYGVVLLDAQSGVILGLHHHEGHERAPADERRTGLDHIAFAVPERADLDRWAEWLDGLGIAHRGVADETDPMPYSVLVFRDPDNIQLELAHMPG